MIKTIQTQNTIIRPVEMPTMDYKQSKNGDTEDKAITTSYFKSSRETTASEFNKLLVEYITLMENKKHL